MKVAELPTTHTGLVFRVRHRMSLERVSTPPHNHWLLTVFIEKKTELVLNNQIPVVMQVIATMYYAEGSNMYEKYPI